MDVMGLGYSYTFPECNSLSDAFQRAYREISAVDYCAWLSQGPVYLIYFSYDAYLY
jgi:hypothetical protein